MKGNHTRKMRMIMALATGLGLSSISQAITLGPIQVNSYLGEPLKAAIRVSDVNPADLNKIKIGLASDADYLRFGVVRTPEQSNLRFQLLSVGNTYIINVDSSNAQMNEPFVNFVLSVEDSEKEHTREYSIFLDPDPRVQAGIRPATSAQSTNNAQTQGWGGARETNVQSAPTRQSAAVARPETSHIQAENGRYQVRRGDTLYSIANTLRPAHIPVQTMVDALFNTNPRAFANRSKDGLIAGSVLIIPENIEQAARSKRSTATRPAPTNAEQIDSSPETTTEIAEILTEENLNNDEQTEIEIDENTETLNTEAEEGDAKEAPTPLFEEESLEEEAVENIEEINSSTEDNAAEIAATEQTAATDEETEANAAGVQESALRLDDTLSLQEETNTTTENLTTDDETLPASTDSASPQPPTEETSPSPTENLPKENISSNETSSPNNPPVAQKPSTPAVTLSEPKFSFPLWQMIAVGVLVLALVALVAGFIITKGRKKKETLNAENSLEEMDEETLRQLEQEIGIHNLDDDNESEYPEDNEEVFFNDAPEENSDDFFDEALSNTEINEKENSINNEKSHQEENEESIDLLDDLALNSLEENQTTEHSDDENFEGLDDFFAEEETSQEEHSSQEDSLNQEDGLNFEEIEDFFTDEDDQSQTIEKTTEEPTPFEDFFDESEPDTSEQKTNDEKPTSAPSSEDAIAFDNDDFFADLSNDDDTLEDKKDEDHSSNKKENQEDEISLEEASLDLENLFNEQENQLAEKEATTSSSEENLKQEPSPETIQAMGINIDLATAYIRSGVKLEKAKKWLEEVLEKGNDAQKAEATELLKKLS